MFWLYLCLFVLFVILLIGSRVYILDILWYNLPPGPLPLPYIGALYRLHDLSVKPWRRTTKFSRIYGKVFTLYFGQYRIISLNGPTAIREAIVQQSKWFSDRPEYFMPGFNQFDYGPLSSNGERWQQQRRFVLKAMRDFGMGKNAMALKIQDEIGFLISELETNNGQQFSNFDRFMANAVSNVICSMVFGKRFAYGDAKFTRLLDMMYEVAAKDFHTNAKFFAFPFLGRFKPAPLIEDALVIEKIIREYLDESLEDHRQDFDDQNIRDFPDLYLQACQNNETAIAEESFVAMMRDMFAAGTETTASSLTWTAIYLCKYPHIQQKCHAELDRVIKTDRLPTLEDRPNLVYLDAVMNETLRHATIVPSALFHCSTDSETKKLAGFDIPHYSMLSYNIWGLHHDPDYWQDPETFWPERWIDPKTGCLLNHSSHFMPFGIGPRICLGEAMAKMEYFLFLASMLQRFNFEFQDKDYDVDLESGRHNITHVPPKFNLVVKKRL